jgi:hypothetical protein
MRRADDSAQQTPGAARSNPGAESMSAPMLLSRTPTDAPADARLELWPAAVFAALALIFFWKAAFTGLVLSGYDTFAYFYPYFGAAADAVRHLRLPLWNPDVFMGAPLLANLQMALFYPATILFYVLPVPYALSYDLILHVVLAAFFTYHLARQAAAVGRAGALAAGITFAFSGFFAAQAGHVNQISAAVWLPLMLLLFDRACKRRSVLSTMLCGVVIGLTLLAGHTQETYMTLCALGGFFVWQSAAGTRRALNLHMPPGRSAAQSVVLAARMLASAFRANLRGFATLLLALLIGAGLAAIQLAPSLELAALSIRAGGMGYRQVVSFSLNPLTLPQALLPGYWQNPFSEYVGFVGVTGLLLAILGAATHWRHPQTGFFVFLAGAGLLLAFGGYTPLYILGYGLVPGFGLFRVPARWLYIYTFGMSMLVGLGLDWIQGRAAAGGAAIARQASTVAAGLAGQSARQTSQFAGILASRLPPSPWAPVALTVLALTLVHAFKLPAIVAWLALTLSVLWLLRLVQLASRSRSLLTPVAALLVVLVLELFAASRDMEYNHPTAPESVTALRPALAHLLADEQPYRILSLSRGLFDPGDLADMRLMMPEKIAADFATAAKNKEVLAPNTPMLFGIQSMDGYDGGILPLKRYVDLQQLFMAPWQVSVDGRMREQLTRIPDGRLLSMINVKYVIADKVHDVWVDGNYYDLGNTAALSADAPSWRLPNLQPFPTTSLGLVSYLVDAPDLPDGSPVATLIVTGIDGRTHTYILRAGRDTAEGEYGPKSKSGALLHKQARVASSWQDEPEGKNYFSKIALDQPIVPRSVEIRFAAPGGQLALRGLSLLDERVGASQPLVVSNTGSFRLVHSGDVKVYENLDVLPRAFSVHAVQIMQTNRAVLDTLADPGFHPADSAVLVADGMDVSSLGRLSAGAQDQVSIAEYAPERVVVKADLGANGLLVLADMWYPGWRAYVDGVEQPIYRVYHAFRGVSVLAGSHTVEFVYQPVTLVWGAVVSVASLAALLVAIRLATRGSRPLSVTGQLRPRLRETARLRTRESSRTGSATSSWRQQP